MAENQHQCTIRKAAVWGGSNIQFPHGSNAGIIRGSKRGSHVGITRESPGNRTQKLEYKKYAGILTPRWNSHVSCYNYHMTPVFHQNAISLHTEFPCDSRVSSKLRSFVNTTRLLKQILPCGPSQNCQVVFPMAESGQHGSIATEDLGLGFSYNRGFWAVI